MNTLKTIISYLIIIISCICIPNNVLATEIIFEVDATPKELIQKNTIYELFTEEEIQLLFRVVETETHGADYESKKNVASVIFNRYEQYNKSLKDIITSPNQFGYNKKFITDSTVKACEDALNDRGNVSKALFFRSDKCPNTWLGRPFIYSDSATHYFY